MTEKSEETVILSLNLDEGKEAAYQTTRLDPSTSVRIECSVDGETHSEPDLGWVRDGRLFTGSEDTVIIDQTDEENKTALTIKGFNPSHIGEYECSVKRPEGRYQKAKVRLEMKPTMDPTYDPSKFGEILCEPEISEMCQNGGICYRHVESQSVSCRCPHSYYGQRCQYRDDNDVLVITESGTEIHTRTIAAGTFFSLCALVFAVIFVYICKKRMRANRSINGNYDDFLEKANRFSIRSNSSIFAKNLEKKLHQAVERVNSSQPNSPLKKTRQNCALPYVRWSDSALSIKSTNEQCSLKSHSFEQVSPKQAVVHMAEENKPPVHELNCSKIAEIV